MSEKSSTNAGLEKPKPDSKDDFAATAQAKATEFLETARSKVWELKTTVVGDDFSKTMKEKVDDVSKMGLDDWLDASKRKITGAQQYVSGGDFQKLIDDVQKTGRDYFQRFEQQAGIVLPDADNYEADRLREKMRATRSQYEKELREAKLAATSQREKLDQLVKSYEEEGAKWVGTHEDALQFKFLSSEIAKEALKQRQTVEDLMEDEMRQYAFQAKDCAAQLSIVSSLNHKMLNGLPYETELQGLLSFQKMSKLAATRREMTIEPSIIHEDIKEYSKTGAPSKTSLYQTFEDLYPQAQQMVWVLPDSGLPGRIWKSFSSSLASEESDDLHLIRQSLTHGDVKAAQSGLQRWMANNMVLRTDLPSSDVPQKMRQFSKDLDAHLRCCETTRYLQTKMLAQQKGLLQ